MKTTQEWFVMIISVMTVLAIVFIIIAVNMFTRCDSGLDMCEADPPYRCRHLTCKEANNGLREEDVYYKKQMRTK